VAREAARVTAERDKALEVRSFLMEMFGASGANRATGDTVTVRRLLDLQAAGLDRAYADNPALKAEMMEVLADGYDRLGLYQAAEPLARGALALRRAAPGNDEALAASLNLHGWIQHELGRFAEAEPFLREAIAIRRAGGPLTRVDLSRSLNDLGVVLQAQQRYPEADSVLSEALAIRRAEFGDEHRSVGITANNLAAGYYFEKRLDEAVATQEVALHALQRAVGPDHQRTIVARSNLAAFRSARGDWRAAAAEYRNLLDQQTRLQGRDHPVTTRVLFSLAGVLQSAGLREQDTLLSREAELLYRQAVAQFEAALGASHPQLGSALHRLATVQAQLGRPGAAASARRAVTVLRAAQGDTARATQAARRLLDSLTATSSRSAFP
jgi:tetratricopeptide (TPR) repeat protein